MQEESPDAYGEWSGAAMCPASDTAVHVPRARMGSEGQVHITGTRSDRAGHAPGSPDPVSPTLRHTCPLTSSHRRQPQAAWP